MKILQVLYSGLGGHGSVVTSLVNSDKKNEWEHCLLFYGVEEMLPTYRKFCEEKKIQYEFIKKKKGILRSSGTVVRKVMKKFNPDTIILHSPNLIIPSWLFAAWRRKKIIVVEHTPHDAKGIGETIGTFFSIILARKVICLSSEYRQQLKKKFSLLPVLRKTIIIPNGVNLQKFCPTYRQAGNELHFGMIGRFSHQKNQEMIIAAAERIFSSEKSSDCLHFHFAGIGENMEPLMRITEEKKLEKHVHFHGLLNEEGIIDLLHKLDVYVHASYAETMCTSVMQAMACGLPVVASNIPGIKNIVKEKENAFLFENGDIKNLAELLESLQNDSSRERMGLNARQYAIEHFSSEETFNRYNKMIHSL